MQAVSWDLSWARQQEYLPVGYPKASLLPHVWVARFQERVSQEKQAEDRTVLFRFVLFCFVSLPP